jgi:hypothetical protein
MADPESSSSSSFTAKEPVLTSSSPDVESQQGRNNPSHWFLVRHPDGVTDAVLNHAYPGQGTPESPYVVDFLPQDGSNPMLYSRTKKWAITMLQALATLAVAFVSTAYSGGVSEIIRYFHVSTIVAILGVSLFVLGFAIGPLLWAPLSGMVSCDLAKGKLYVWGDDADWDAMTNRVSREADCFLLHLLWPGRFQRRRRGCSEHPHPHHPALLRRRVRRIAPD